MGKSRFRREKEKLKRRAGFRQQKPIVLIVCEGEKTEPNYFNDLR